MLPAPFTDATGLTLHGRDRAVISEANGFAGFSEEARLMRNARGGVTALWLGGSRSVPETVGARELRQVYGG